MVGVSVHRCDSRSKSRPRDRISRNTGGCLDNRAVLRWRGGRDVHSDVLTICELENTFQRVNEFHVSVDGLVPDVNEAFVVTSESLLGKS